MRVSQIFAVCFKCRYLRFGLPFIIPLPNFYFSNHAKTRSEKSFLGSSDLNLCFVPQICPKTQFTSGLLRYSAKSIYRHDFVKFYFFHISRDYWKKKHFVRADRLTNWLQFEIVVDLDLISTNISGTISSFSWVPLSMREYRHTEFIKYYEPARKQISEEGLHGGAVISVIS